MKISCQSCQAKYTIADEKVLGKIVKIRCKKCGATIVINGNEPEAMTQGASPQAGGGGAAFDYAAQSGGEPWTVNVSDGDQRSMTLAEIVGAFQSGVVNDETYCWKDGMSDWLPLREIPELQSACAGGAPAHAHQQPAYEQQAPQEEATQAGFSSLFGGGQQQQPQNGSASLFGGGEAAAASPAAAARRAGGRGGGGADLFGGIAQAGGEQDVMTSASANPHPVADDKLTGARNENSVLFSLAALTSSAPEKKDPVQAPGTEGSGLIDIRALSASMEQKKDGGKKVDDIMNLSGGGAFSAALAAPVLAPAPADAADYGGGGEPKKSNMGLVLGIVGGFVILGLLVGGGVFLAMSKNQSPAPTTTATATTAAPTTSVAENDTANAAGGGTADPNTGAQKPGVGSSGGGAGAVHQGGGGGGVAHTGGGGGGVQTGGGGGAVVDPPHTGGGGGTAGCAPGDLQCAMAHSAGVPNTGGGTTTSGGGGASAPFDRSAAASSLGSIASGLGSCKRGDGPSGQGHAKVTFAPSGSVSSVEIDGGPFPGTAVGGCVAGKLRGAHVPAFAGGAITVGKSFNI